jgi:hypothetical protein
MNIVKKYVAQSGKMTKNEMRNLNSFEDIEFVVKHIDNIAAVEIRDE